MMIINQNYNHRKLSLDMHWNFYEVRIEQPMDR